MVLKSHQIQPVKGGSGAAHVVLKCCWTGLGGASRHDEVRKTDTQRLFKNAFLLNGGPAEAFGLENSIPLWEGMNPDVVAPKACTIDQTVQPTSSFLVKTR